MTKEEIIAGNKLIAEFLEWVVYNSGPSSWYETGIDFIDSPDINKLKFHKDWNWLMLAVEKIESQKNYVQINGTSCHIDSNDGEYSETNCCTMNNKFESDNDEETKIKSVWITVIQFINWHNQNNKS